MQATALDLYGSLYAFRPLQTRHCLQHCPCPPCPTELQIYGKVHWQCLAVPDLQVEWSWFAILLTEMVLQSCHHSEIIHC